MNIERLQMIAKHLRESPTQHIAPDVNFNLCYWMGSEEYYKEDGEMKDPKLINHPCGTTVCALGSFAMTPYAQAQGLALYMKNVPGYGNVKISDIRDYNEWFEYMVYLNGDADRAYLLPLYEDRKGFGAAVRFFGIDYYTAYSLFDPDYYTLSERKDPEAVIQRLEYLIEHGEEHFLWKMDKDR